MKSFVNWHFFVVILTLNLGFLQLLKLLLLLMILKCDFDFFAMDIVTWVDSPRRYLLLKVYLSLSDLRVIRFLEVLRRSTCLNYVELLTARRRISLDTILQIFGKRHFLFPTHDKIIFFQRRT